MLSMFCYIKVIIYVAICDLILENRPCMHLPGFQEIQIWNIQSMQYSLLMLGSSHVRFVPEIQ